MNNETERWRLEQFAEVIARCSDVKLLHKELSVQDHTPTKLYTRIICDRLNELDRASARSSISIDEAVRLVPAGKTWSLEQGKYNVVAKVEGVVFGHQEPAAALAGAVRAHRNKERGKHNGIEME